MYSTKQGIVDNYLDKQGINKAHQPGTTRSHLFNLQTMRGYISIETDYLTTEVKQPVSAMQMVIDRWLLLYGKAAKRRMREKMDEDVSKLVTSWKRAELGDDVNNTFLKSRQLLPFISNVLKWQPICLT